MTAEPSATTPDPATHREAPIAQVRGTRDWMPGDFAAIARLERTLMDHFAAAGFEAIRTPILEVTELHERKSGASIVSKLFELADGPGRLCLRPELTASVVRAYIDAPGPAPIPWRVCSSGPVFRFEREPGPTRYREFTQAGVELLGAPGPEADAEVIALAIDAAKAVGLDDVTVRVGHTGLIVEVLERCGLPTAAVASLVEHLSDAAAEGRNVRALESALERLSGWLQGDAEQEAESVLPAIDRADDPGVDRLFRHLVPRVTGRRTGHEIVNRLRKKWALGHSLGATLERVRDRVHALADLRGPAVEVLQGLEQGYAALAPGTISSFYAMLDVLEARGIPPERVELDLGFGHGIGFYSQMIFDLSISTPSGPLGVCHGGRYDGLARVLGSDRDPHGVGFAFGVERLYHALETRPR
jgi:histidyl-tRNA synthetase